MENKISINEKGIIEVNMTEDQDEAAVIETTRLFVELSKQLKAENKPVLLLVDLSKITNIFSTNLRKTGFGLLKDLEFDKAAMYSQTALVRYLIDLFNNNIMKQANLKVFESRESAEEWLVS